MKLMALKLTFWLKMISRAPQRSAKTPKEVPGPPEKGGMELIPPSLLRRRKTILQLYPLIISRGYRSSATVFISVKEGVIFPVLVCRQNKRALCCVNAQKIKSFITPLKDNSSIHSQGKMSNINGIFFSIFYQKEYLQRCNL